MTLNNQGNKIINEDKKYKSRNIGQTTSQNTNTNDILTTDIAQSMVVDLEVCFLLIKQMVGEYMNIKMVIHIEENMKMIEQMDMENIIMKMVQLIMEIGLIMCNMG